MLSNNNIKFVNSLQLKKQRDKNNLYLVEGDKMVREYLFSDEDVVWLFAKPEWISSIPKDRIGRVQNVIPVSYEELKKISTLKTPHNSMALVATKNETLIPSSLTDNISLVLDNIQDPGNLGTIIRVAGWFGIPNIVCSIGSVDVYNPKVIQATMGALIYVKIHYTELSPFLNDLGSLGLPLYATTLSGESIYKSTLPGAAAIIFGNESKGISENILSLATNRIMIPSFGDAGSGIDSLNVGMSAAIVCSEVRRHSS